MDANRTPENRYHRQQLLPQIGPDGQRKISSARILLVGCGALGTNIADQLARAGVGFLRIVDRDTVELTNLQRQVLFDEEDVRQETPKAIAAANRLRRINSGLEIDPRVTDVHSGNIEELIDVNLILDGTDNAETRYLINDVAVKHVIPWIYGACVGVEGRVMPILPGETACLRCLFPEPPAVGELPTCDTAGILASAAAVVASHQVVAALKIITGAATSASEMLSFDIWSHRSRAISLSNARRPDCPCCGQRRFEFLDHPATGTISLCGRNAIQIRPPRNAAVNLTDMSHRLAAVGEVHRTDYMLRCRPHDDREITLTLFPDGRIIIYGTTDPSRARSLAARLIGI